MGWGSGNRPEEEGTEYRDVGATGSVSNRSHEMGFVEFGCRPRKEVGLKGFSRENHEPVGETLNLVPGRREGAETVWGCCFCVAERLGDVVRVSGSTSRAGGFPRIATTNTWK